MRVGKPIVEGDRPVRGGSSLLIGLFGWEIRHRPENRVSICLARVGCGIAGVLVYRPLKELRSLFPTGIADLVHLVPALHIELVGFGIFRGAPFEPLMLFSV